MLGSAELSAQPPPGGPPLREQRTSRWGVGGGGHASSSSGLGPHLYSWGARILLIAKLEIKATVENLPVSGALVFVFRVLKKKKKQLASKPGFPTE